MRRSDWSSDVCSSDLLRRFQIVAEFLEQDLGVIGNAVQLHVEACLDAFGLHEERRGAAPGAEQQRAAAKLVIVDADHATFARGVDDVRSVEAAGADVRPVADACAAQARKSTRMNSSY